MDSVILVTEANDRVATGHLMECIVCADELQCAGYHVAFWVNHDAPVGLKERIPCSYQEYQHSIEVDCLGVIEELICLKPCAIIFNLREISNAVIVRIREAVGKNIKIICIDELGHRDLSADIIVNPMIDPYFWSYGNSPAQLYCGEQYLMLEKRVSLLHERKKKINQEVRIIVITMGGVDPQNYTSALLNLIPHYFTDTIIEVIIGAGNAEREEIIKIGGRNSLIKVYENVSNLPELMYEADLVFCAGGNTLYEAACVGTPAIVLPSMPHERRTAEIFEQNKFCRVIDTERDLETELFDRLSDIKPYHVRKQMSESGKQILDGLGRSRMVNIVSV